MPVTAATSPMHVYEVRPRKDHRVVDLISDALPFGRAVVRRAKRNQLRDVRSLESILRHNSNLL